jgi:hypothetical protein
LPIEKNDKKRIKKREEGRELIKELSGDGNDGATSPV